MSGGPFFTFLNERVSNSTAPVGVSVSLPSAGTRLWCQHHRGARLISAASGCELRNPYTIKTLLSATFTAPRDGAFTACPVCYRALWGGSLRPFYPKTPTSGSRFPWAAAQRRGKGGLREPDCRPGSDRSPAQPRPRQRSGAPQTAFPGRPRSAVGGVGSVSPPHPGRHLFGDRALCRGDVGTAERQRRVLPSRDFPPAAGSPQADG